MKRTYLKIVLPAIILTVSVSSFFMLKNKVKQDSKVKTDALLDIKEKDNELQRKKARLSELESYLNDEFLLLCNKDNKLSDDFLASDIVESKLPFQAGIVTTELNETTAVNARKMFEDAKKEGINLLGASGYRTNAIQTSLFNSKVNSVGLENALKYSAPPGTSEHETGFAIDIVSTEYTALNSDFENTKAFKWLSTNCAKYGFILRYDKDKTDITKYEYEPWHYRYVGNYHAEKIMESDMTLEEYIDSIKNEIAELNQSLN